MRTEVLALLATDCAAVALVLYVVRAMRLARASIAWPTHPGKVLAARATFLSSSRGGSGWFQLYYRYTIGGREYVRSRYQFAHMWLTFGAMQRVAGELTANPDVLVHVDPANPRRATLRAGLPRMAHALAAVSWFVLAIVNLILFLAWR